LISVAEIFYPTEISLLTISAVPIEPPDTAIFLLIAHPVHDLLLHSSGPKVLDPVVLWISVDVVNGQMRG
jgi:hypothetical protein